MLQSHFFETVDLVDSRSSLIHSKSWLCGIERAQRKRKEENMFLSTVKEEGSDEDRKIINDKMAMMGDKIEIEK